MRVGAGITSLAIILSCASSRGLAENWQHRAAEGRKYAETLQTAVHAGSARGTPAASTEFDREWSAWGDESLEFDEMMIGVLALPEEEAAKFLVELRDATKGWADD